MILLLLLAATIIFGLLFYFSLYIGFIVLIIAIPIVLVQILIDHLREKS